MIVLKLALYTCAFYLAVALVIDAIIIALAYWTGGVMVMFRSWTGIAVLTGFFGLIWLGCFVTAFRIVFANVWTRLGS